MLAEGSKNKAPQHSLATWPFSLLVERLRDYHDRRAVYRRSGADLSAFSNREIANLGLYRSVITATAIKAAWGKPAHTSGTPLPKGARFYSQLMRNLATTLAGCLEQ